MGLDQLLLILYPLLGVFFGIPFGRWLYHLLWEPAPPPRALPPPPAVPPVATFRVLDEAPRTPAAPTTPHARRPPPNVFTTFLEQWFQPGQDQFVRANPGNEQVRMLEEQADMETVPCWLCGQPLDGRPHPECHEGGTRGNN